jgi:hypothetical protein
MDLDPMINTSQDENDYSNYDNRPIRPMDQDALNEALARLQCCSTCRLSMTMIFKVGNDGYKRRFTVLIFTIFYRNRSFQITSRFYCFPTIRGCF